MRIYNVTAGDATKWQILSREYDKYVMELTPDITSWYEGDNAGMSFSKYMDAKIIQNEAFIAASDKRHGCFGIIAISVKNNRITFFAISHCCGFYEAGKLLLSHGIGLLDQNKDISTNIIKSKAEHIQKQYTLFSSFGFTFLTDGSENGVPVEIMVRKPTAG